jgi:EAL domain-containing protein (putative c-di-GMP-specific phosphodiesterase class I)
MNSSRSDKPDAAGDSRSAVQWLVDTEQSDSGADQTAADLDQTASDQDQAASETDEANAASDQLAADLDQASADRQRPADLGGVALEAFDSSHLARERSRAGRLSAQIARARTARSRAGNADERDAIATARDETARRRDLREEAIEHAIAASDEPLEEKLHQVRVRAAAARTRARGDRNRAALNRSDGARDRAGLVDRLAQLAHERVLIAEMIRGLRAGDTPEATAQAICRQIVGFTGVAAAALLIFGPDEHAWPIGVVVAGGPDPPLRRVPLHRSRHLRERAVEGPWIEPWANQLGHPYNGLFKGLGVHSVACAPVRHDGRLIGLLVVDATTSAEEIAIAEVLPALVEFADLAGALIGRDVAERTEARRGRDHIASIIASRAFRPIFQPIVDLTSNMIVGYEALTRFSDGANPEVVFAEAAAVGLGIELETATLQAALAAAEALPKSAWLNLNASPDFILAGEPLRTILNGRRRRRVLEVTEHAAITDYRAFREAMTNLGPRVDFAVDDAGTGFASLRHILELHPAFVKLDRSLIDGIETDAARQAMIVGLCHFASTTGCRLVVEGIETQAELAVLRSLTIELGQGYLLGRPLPVDEVGRSSPARVGTATPVKREPRQNSQST